MKSYLFSLLLLVGMQGIFAQDDLLDLLDAEEEPRTDYTIATFKTVRIINGHSIEMPAPGVMQMIISHRFGRLNGGLYELYGLDQANIRIGLEQGITPWLTIGAGRSNIKKTYDGFVKWKLLRQSTGARKMPITLAGQSTAAVNTLRTASLGLTIPEENFKRAYRYSYVHQLLIARKFSERLSVQIMPTVVHRNLVPTAAESNVVLAGGIGGRIKLTRSLTLNAEYYYVLPDQLSDEFRNYLGVGIDIETGGHVFQLVFSNTRSMTDNLFLTETDGDWLAGDIHFGFNVMRVFTTANKWTQKYQGKF
ncbi:MAG: DUF5777 family beta-barrel protein [Bacteroidota bacterium]